MRARDFGDLAAQVWADRDLIPNPSHRMKFHELQVAVQQMAPSDVRRFLHWGYVLALTGRTSDAAAACDAFAYYCRPATCDGEAQETLAQLCLLTKHYAPLCKLLSAIHSVDFTIQWTPGAASAGAARWNFRRSQFAFTFGEQILDHHFMHVILKHWIHSLPVLSHYARQAGVREGEISINLEDFGTVPGLAFCDFRENFFLVPDPIFIQTGGYAKERDWCTAHGTPWSQRKPVAFWRGQTTGLTDCHGNPALTTWRALPRVMLCEIARNAPNPERFDVGLSGIVQISDSKWVAEIEDSGLMADYVPFTEFMNFKYQIDIDGNSSAWPGLFTKLLTGNPVLKVKSPRGFRQWYYDRLVAWKNYVPVEANMADLSEKVNWLVDHDDQARRIGEEGRTLALAITTQNEIASAVPTIAAAFADAGASGHPGQGGSRPVDPA